jgi:hypothetical protein
LLKLVLTRPEPSTYETQQVIPRLTTKKLSDL